MQKPIDDLCVCGAGRREHTRIPGGAGFSFNYGLRKYDDLLCPTDTGWCFELLLDCTTEYDVDDVDDVEDVGHAPT